MKKRTALALMLVAGAFATAPATAAPGSGSTTAPTDTRDYTLTVASAHGNPSPAVGTHTYAWQATVSASVEAATDGFACTGWTGTGAVPETGDTHATGDIVLTEVASTLEWQWEAVSVWNVAVAQRPGTKLVDISYDLAADTDTVRVLLEVRDGDTVLPASSLTGDIGMGVTPGIGKAIVWDAGADWNGNVASGVTFTLTVEPDSGIGPGPEGMVLVEGGTLAMSMGTVTVDTFYIGIYEVTWGEWQEVQMWAAGSEYDIVDVGVGCADDHPVQNLNWYDVAKWSNAKSEMEGLTPVYTVEGQVYRSGEPGFAAIAQNLTADGYRLPLEVEWEFAARGGNQTNGYTYAGSNDLNKVGWYSSNSSGADCQYYGNLGTWPVGSKIPNELGIYDMSGNVMEYVWGHGSNRGILRGGGFNYNSSRCTVVFVETFNPSGRYKDRGLRLARTPAP